MLAAMLLIKPVSKMDTGNFYIFAPCILTKYCGIVLLKPELGRNLHVLRSPPEAPSSLDASHFVP